MCVCNSVGVCVVVGCCVSGKPVYSSFGEDAAKLIAIRMYTCVQYKFKLLLEGTGAFLS